MPRLASFAFREEGGDKDAGCFRAALRGRARPSAAARAVLLLTPDSSRNHQYRIGLDQSAARQGGDADRGARRKGLPEIGSHDLVDLGEMAEIGEIDRQFRSEERRVGKECRSRWSPYH